jgi:hypothetical protein
MKKFCSTCGNQLELSQRFCNQCGAVNPFFVSTFSFLSDQSDELERLRLEKERIDKELAEKEERQAEFRKQEQLRKEAEDAERMKLENQEKERLAKEQQERERIEQALKQELLKVKEETELYKKETHDWVNEVRQGLQQIGEDNKRLKEDVANLSRAGVTVSSTERVNTESSSKQKGFIVSLAVILLGLTSVLAFFYFTTRYDTTSQEPQPAKQQSAIQPLENSEEVIDSLPAVDTVAVTSAPVETPASAITNAPITKAAPAILTEPFVLEVSRVKRDLIGKKISGCDIIIGSASEIGSVSNLILVEKLGSGNLKYKLTMSIAQGEENFTATPYVYYTPDGGFIKVDGTNCE